MTHIGPHLYELTEIKGLVHGKWSVKRVIYRCILPDCRHYLNEPELAIHRLSLCHGGCGEAVKIDKSMPKKPTCDDCKRKKRESRRIA